MTGISCDEKYLTGIDSKRRKIIIKGFSDFANEYTKKHGETNDILEVTQAVGPSNGYLHFHIDTPKGTLVYETDKLF